LIVTKEEFIKRVLEKLEEKLKRELPEQDFLSAMIDKYVEILKREYIFY